MRHRVLWCGGNLQKWTTGGRAKDSMLVLTQPALLKSAQDAQFIPTLGLMTWGNTIPLIPANATDWVFPSRDLAGRDLPDLPKHTEQTKVYWKAVTIQPTCWDCSYDDDAVKPTIASTDFTHVPTNYWDQRLLSQSKPTYAFSALVGTKTYVKAKATHGVYSLSECWGSPCCLSHDIGGSAGVLGDLVPTDS